MPVNPDRIGKYKIESVVARGGMGLVYLAVHPTLKRKVIIKKLRIRGNTAVLERFKREAQILLDLQHVNIVHMFDYFTEGPFHYIVLEYIDGMALDKLIAKRKRLSWQLAFLIVRDACKALSYAHKKTIVHRDIKPGNILMSKRGAIKLADFGIAFSERTGESGEGTDESKTVVSNAATVSDKTVYAASPEEDVYAGTELDERTVTLGTPAYMPPEQFTDSNSVDSRADIYAMGVMLYEMITGVKPFGNSMNSDTLLRIKTGRCIAPEKLEKKLPFGVARIIRKMMAAKVSRRYRSAAAVLKALNAKLKRYDQRELRVSMVKLMLFPQYSEPALYESKYKKHYKRMAIGAAVCAALLLIGVCWHKGYIHRTLLRPWYTPLELTLKIPASASVNPDLPVGAFFFYNDNDLIPEVPYSRRFFYKKHETSSSNLYTIKPLSLRPGKYRIKIAAGPYVWWRSVNITRKKAEIYVDFSSKTGRPLSIRTEARDLKTGANISASTEFFVWSAGSWIPIQDINKNGLTGAKVWKIKAQKTGYKSEIFSLRIEWYQEDLFISALLQPE